MTGAERVRAELEVLGLDASRHVLDFYAPLLRRARGHPVPRPAAPAQPGRAAGRRGEGRHPDPADPLGAPGRLPHPRRRHRPGRRHLLRGRAGAVRGDGLPLLAARRPRGAAADRSARGLAAGDRCLGAARAVGRLDRRRAATPSARSIATPGVAGATPAAVRAAAASRSAGRAARPPVTEFGVSSTALRPRAGDVAGRDRAAGRRPGRRATAAAAPTGAGPAAMGGGMGGGRAPRGCWCTPAGSGSRPYADIKTPGEDTRDTRRMLAAEAGADRRGPPPTASHRASCGTPAPGAAAPMSGHRRDAC